MTEHRNPAWDDFWDRSGPGGKAPAGCLPSQMDPVSRQQCEAWQAFATLIPAGAAVLDLASGDGRVLGWLRAVRSDLSLTGIDLAAQLPPAPAGITLHANVPMEALPFSDGSIGCVVSQFGLEYSDLPRAIGEIDRVVQHGGLIGLLTHRADGPILAHNLARSGHIRWALDTQGLPTQARAALATRGAGGETVPVAIAEAPAIGASTYGSKSAAWEVAEAIRRCMDYGRHDDPEKVRGLIDTIEAKARNELERIAALEQACGRTMPPAQLTAVMAEHGFEETELRGLASPSDPRPFADFRIYRRRRA